MPSISTGNVFLDAIGSGLDALSQTVQGVTPLVSATGGLVNQIRNFGKPTAAPGGATFFGGTTLPNVSTTMARSANFPSLGLPGVDLVPNNTPGAGFGSVACITPRAGTSMRLPSRVDVPTTDASGNSKVTTYKNMGRPVLYSGDIAAARRVRKVAARARRARGGR